MFISALRRELLSKGHPAARLETVLRDDNFLACGLTVADALETRGFSFIGQVPGVSDFLDELLRRGVKAGQVA
jgi:hypothetical protein